MKKQVILMIIGLFIIGLLGTISFLKINKKQPNEKQIAMFIQENQETLEAIRTIAFADPRQLQLEPGRRIWYSLEQCVSEEVNQVEAVNDLYEQLIGTQMIKSIFEGELSNDQDTITYPALRFNNYYKVSRTSYETIGCVYIESEEPLDVEDYRLNQLVHLTGKWYYFRTMPQT